ncbi:MAG: prepilin-type N-terminal cleavage/methylation domain-containing protein [Acidimicrobiia bacterium]
MKKQFERLHAARVGKGEGGFTLIELLIVIVILGILAAVVVFSVSGITNSGAEGACKTDVKSVEVALEAYRAQLGAYPANAQADLTTDGSAATPVTQLQLINAWPGQPGHYTIAVPANTNTINVTDQAGVTVAGVNGCDTVT